DLVQRPDPDLAAEAAGQVRPDEPDRAGGDLEQPHGHRPADRVAEQLPPRDALDLVAAERLDRLAGQRPRPVDGLDLIVAHEVIDSLVKARSGGRSSCSRRTAGTGLRRMSPGR